MKNTDDFMRIEGHPEPLEIQENYEEQQAAAPAPKVKKSGKPDRVGDFAWAGIAAICVLALVGVVYFLSGTPERQAAEGQPMAYTGVKAYVEDMVDQVGNDLSTVGATDAAMGDTPDVAAVTDGEADAVYLFTLDSSDIAENAELNKLAQEAIDQDAYVAIVAYTDPSGSDTYNQQLSARRADSVADYLAHHGVSKNHIVTKGMGETSAYATAQQDRRAELRLI